MVSDTVLFEEVATQKQSFLKYSNFGIEGTSWLAFREIKKILKHYKCGKRALDYGCGAGRSTRYLKSLGVNPIGVDICPKILEEALKFDEELNYFLINNARVPVINNYFDLVFSSFTLIMVSSKLEMSLIVQEMHRILKKGGLCIIITGSEELHCPNKVWNSYDTDFPENYNLRSGSMAKLKIKEVDVIFTDYNWLNEDYVEIIEGNGFQILETLSPLGKGNDPYPWFSEKDTSPYLIYVARKL